MKYVKDSFIGRRCIVYTYSQYGELYEYARGTIISYRLGQVVVCFEDGMISPWISTNNIGILE